MFSGGGSVSAGLAMPAGDQGGRTVGSDLLSPRSVALVGASNDPAKTASRPLAYLTRAGFGGRVYPINPHHDTVGGAQAWQSLSALPERPDHAFILTPTDAAIAAVGECAALGIPVATVLASGFSEAGQDGARRVDQLRDAAKGAVRVLGPSSLGLVNPRRNLMLTANAAFAEDEVPAGNVFCASHSGSLIGALMSRGKARGIGFAGMVSVGNETDLSIGEICAATLDDPDVRSYVLFLETIRHADALRAFALGAHERGKPVVAYKLGRTPEGAELALTHTGALAGEDDVADAFLADCGISRVETFEALLEAPALLARASVPGGQPAAVGVVTTTGGGAAMVVDQLASRGVTVAERSTETSERLAAAGIDIAPGRIADLTLAGTRYDVMKPALDILLDAPEFDLIIAVVGSSARFQPELAVRPVIDSAGAAKPLCAFLVPDAPDALAMLGADGIAAFRTPEACADAVAAAFRRRAPAQSRPPVSDEDADGHLLDELDSYAVLDRLGIPHAPAAVLAVDAPDGDLPFDYPVVVKALSAGLAHKSDVGGVALNVPDRQALAQAAARMAEDVRDTADGLELERVLVQPMVTGLAEVLVGYRRDPRVGPIVMLAAGGIMTEIHRDRAIRLAPTNAATAFGMIEEVRALRALDGYRGRTPGDLTALADAIAALSRCAELSDLAVTEAEINPLIVRREGEGVVAVDAVVRVADHRQD